MVSHCWHCTPQIFRKSETELPFLHPHFHILLFTKYHVHNPRGSVMRMQFFEQWKKACEKAGLDQPSYEHGLDLRNGQKAAKYVAKWGLEHELTNF